MFPWTEYSHDMIFSWCLKSSKNCDVIPRKYLTLGFYVYVTYGDKKRYRYKCRELERFCEKFDNKLVVANESERDSIEILLFKKSRN